MSGCSLVVKHHPATVETGVRTSSSTPQGWIVVRARWPGVNNEQSCTKLDEQVRIVRNLLKLSEADDVSKRPSLEEVGNEILGTAEGNQSQTDSDG